MVIIRLWKCCLQTFNICILISDIFFYKSFHILELDLEASDTSDRQISEYFSQVKESDQTKQVESGFERRNRTSSTAKILQINVEVAVYYLDTVLSKNTQDVEYFWTVGDSFDDELQIFPQCKIS